MRVLGKARQHLQGFLLRHGRIYPGKKGWTVAYRRWLTTVRFQHHAQQIVFQDYVDAVADAEARVERLTGQIADLLPDWSLAPVVKAVQAMRGVAFIVAVTVVAEVGDFQRFDNPRQLMAYLGLTPSEHSPVPPCYPAYGLSPILEARHRPIRRNPRMQNAAGETTEPVSSGRDHVV